MKPVILVSLLTLIVGCASPADDSSKYPYVDLPCAEIHCTTVVCGEDPSEPCECLWPPANTILCNGGPVVYPACADLHCAAVECGEDPSEPCECLWPPDYWNPCDGDAEGK